MKATRSAAEALTPVRTARASSAASWRNRFVGSWRGSACSTSASAPPRSSVSSSRAARKRRSCAGRRAGAKARGGLEIHVRAVRFRRPAGSPRPLQRHRRRRLDPRLQEAQDLRAAPPAGARHRRPRRLDRAHAGHRRRERRPGVSRSLGAAPRRTRCALRGLPAAAYRRWPRRGLAAVHVALLRASTDECAGPDAWFSLNPFRSRSFSPLAGMGQAARAVASEARLAAIVAGPGGHAFHEPSADGNGLSRRGDAAPPSGHRGASGPGSGLHRINSCRCSPMIAVLSLARPSSGSTASPRRRPSGRTHARRSDAAPRRAA